MTIREILDAVDREIAGHRAAINRLQAMRRRILATCRDGAEQGRGREDEEQRRCLPISEHSSRRRAVKQAA